MEQQQVDTAAIQASATTAERTRIAAILESSEAKGREQAALRLALKTNMPADAATAVLGTLPAAAASPLAAAMPPNPDVKPGAEGAGDKAQEDALVKSIVEA